MDTTIEQKSKAYALYTFIDADTAKNCGIKQYTLEPNLVWKYKVLCKLLAYAYKNCFNIPEKDGYPVQCIKTGARCYNGVHFSFGLCVRMVCVAVSTQPIGIDMQVPFFNGKDDFANTYFNERELEEYKSKPYGDDTLYYIKCKKAAYKKKFNLDGTLSDIDSTEQKTFTVHSEYYPNESTSEKYFFAATDDVTFIKVPIETFLP